MKPTCLFGNKLIELLNLLDLSQADLARKAGITEAAISHYIKDKRKPNYETFMKINKVLQDELKLWLFTSSLVGEFK